MNPTQDALEQRVASLEGGVAALAVSSGQSATTLALLNIAEAGDHIVSSASLYGGTSRLVREVLPALGIASRIVRPSELSHVAELATPRTRALIVESPTNPSLQVIDLKTVSSAAHDRGLAVMVDNTFATPVLQQPLRLGADLVMHSLTKALSGHSDLIGGALVGPKDRIDRARSLLKVLGGCMDPHAAFLALRGIRTLHLRVQRQGENALALARHLESHSKVARVVYPGLPSHPAHEVARSQMSGFGGLVSFVLHGGLPAAERFFDGLRVMARAASLGGVETLVSLPVHTSHHGYSDEQLREAGVHPGMVRVSLGVEDAVDLLGDADRALSGV
jgi:cystathionine beta-lyase/cystathionine gamma-synthase